MTDEQKRREELVDRIIDLAIDEDIATGDVTTDRNGGRDYGFNHPRIDIGSGDYDGQGGRGDIRASGGGEGLPQVPE